MMDRGQIEKRLKKLPKEFAVVFAVRMATRVLPLLASRREEDDPFWFWSDKKARHLFAIVNAQRAVFFQVIAADYPMNDAITYFNSADIHITAAAVSSAEVYAAAYAAHAYAATNAYAYADAAFFAAAEPSPPPPTPPVTALNMNQWC